MYKIIVLTIVFGSVAAAAALMIPRDETAPRRIESAPAAMSSAVDFPQPVAAARAAEEFIDESDITGLLQETPSVEEFLTLADAAAEQPLAAAERSRLAALLRSDPELRKHFRD